MTSDIAVWPRETRPGVFRARDVVGEIVRSAKLFLDTGMQETSWVNVLAFIVAVSVDFMDHVEFSCSSDNAKT